MNYRDFLADPNRDCAIIAHRGIWRDAPENSLLAIERAITQGCDVVEIDVRKSVDGVFVLLHDDTLARMTESDAAPETLTGAELSALRLRNRHGGAENGLTDQTLPTLADVFALTRGRIFIHLDIKDHSLIPEVIAFAKAMGVAEEVDVWHTLGSEADLAWINANIMAEDVTFIAKTRLNLPDAVLQTALVLALKPSICEIYFDDVTDLARHKARFAEAGITLWVNTLDDVSCAGLTDSAALADPGAVWGRLLDAGVSAIQTDEAAALRSYLNSRR